MPTELNVYIGIPELEEITISGTASIEGEGIFTTDYLRITASGASETKMKINVKELESDVSGAAELTLTGEAINHNIEVSGAGNIDAEELITKKVNVDASGAGNANVDATEELTVITSGVAEVRYKDEPPVFNAEEEIIRVEREDEDFVYGNKPEKVNIKAVGVDIEVIEDDDSTNIIIGRHKISVDDDGNVKHKKSKCKKFNGHQLS